MKSTLLPLIFFLFGVEISAQVPKAFKTIPPNILTDLPVCGQDLLLKQARQSMDYSKKERELNTKILQYQSNSTLATTVTLQVVVHVMLVNPYAVSDAEIVAGIADLTDFFGKTGSHKTGKTVDTKIKFCLAKIAPDGGATTGITRTRTDLGRNLVYTQDHFALTSLSSWDPKRYVNIWLVESIQGEAYYDFQCGVWTGSKMAGYATLPPYNGIDDGIVTSGFGKVLYHEMGHYLGLLHTFYGGCKNDNCKTDGDMVCDTPPDASMRSSYCAYPENSCYTDTLSNYSNKKFLKDVPDDIYNVMDYGGALGCNPGPRFTQGQADRIHATVATHRFSLTTEDKCTSPCPTDNIIADFAISSNNPVPGVAIGFTNSSAHASSYEWRLNGSVVSASTNFTYSFPAKGDYNLTLRAYNSSRSCFASVSQTVRVTSCGVKARFHPDKFSTIAWSDDVQEIVSFTNTSSNATSFSWLWQRDNLPVSVFSTDQNPAINFPHAGNYRIQLVASHGSCHDTSAIIAVEATDPRADASVVYASTRCIDSNTIDFSVCIYNGGYGPINANTPISFFDKDPLRAGASKLGPTQYIQSPIPGRCYSCFNFLLPGRRIDYDRIYVAINNDGNRIPLDFSTSILKEIKLDSANVGFAATIHPVIEQSICAGESFEGYNSSGLYIDTFKVINGSCDSVRILHLTVNQLPSPALGSDRDICAGDELILNPGSFSSYLWHDGSMNSQFATSTTGTYAVKVFNEFNCSAVDSMTISRINPVPSNFLPADTILCLKNPLVVHVPGYQSYLWNTKSNFSFIDIEQYGSFKLDVVDKNNCRGSDTVNVSYPEGCVSIQMPNAFSPNNDGRNEIFKPYIGMPVTNFKMTIYNRYGGKIFESTNKHKGWDGRHKGVMQNLGTYVYAITYVDFLGVPKVVKGTVTLLR